MHRVYIVSAKRSPIGGFLGSYLNTSIQDLCQQVINSVLANFDRTLIDEVIVGNVLQANSGVNLARQLSLSCGLPLASYAYNVNMVCGSGLKSVMLACNAIRLNDAQMILAGGVEHMSHAPYFVDAKIRSGLNKKDHILVDSILKDGLIDRTLNQQMGQITEDLNERYNFTTEQQNNYCQTSINRYQMAANSGIFVQEIAKIKLDDVIIDQDEFTKRRFTQAKIETLKPAFTNHGTINAYNASSYADAASFVLLASQKAVETQNLKPIVEIINAVTVGVEPALMGLAPVKVIEKILSNNDLTIKDIKRLEINEAFALQMLAIQAELKHMFEIDDEFLQRILNINGGALAIGHPLAMSANRLVVTLANQLKRDELGIVSVCVGGGMGLGILLKGLNDD